MDRPHAHDQLSHLSSCLYSGFVTGLEILIKFPVRNALALPERYKDLKYIVEVEGIVLVFVFATTQHLSYPSQHINTLAVQLHSANDKWTSRVRRDGGGTSAGSCQDHQDVHSRSNLAKHFRQCAEWRRRFKSSKNPARTVAGQRTRKEGAVEERRGRAQRDSIGSLLQV